VVLNFQPTIHSDALQLNHKAYFTANHDSFFVDGFKMFIGKIALHDEESKTKFTDSVYHFLNAEKSNSLKISENISSLKKITSIDFEIGVDSTTNLQGAMDGDLDPVNGMYWTWNSGYINFKLEGHSPICKSVHHVFEFHIGGYKHPFNTIRTIHLVLKNPILISQKNQLDIKINLAEILNSVDLQTQNNIVEPSEQAMQIANHFQKMFSIEE
jgi:hypothetical protein